MFSCGWRHKFSECCYINKNVRALNFKHLSELEQKVEECLPASASKKKVKVALQKAENLRNRQSSEFQGGSQTDKFSSDTKVQAAATVTFVIF